MDAPAPSALHAASWRSASATEVAEAFDVTRAPSGAAGAFRLTPKDPAMAQILERIDLELAAETGVPRRVVLREASGDSSEIAIVDQESL